MFYLRINVIVNIKATNHAIRYVLALSFFVAKAHTTPISKTANIAAAIYPPILKEVLLNSPDQALISVNPSIASSIANHFLRVGKNNRCWKAL